MTSTPHASKADYRGAFAGLVFPTSKSAVLNRARDNGGLDREVYAILAQISDRKYKTTEDLHEAIRAVYRARGVAAEALPV